MRLWQTFFGRSNRNQMDNSRQLPTYGAFPDIDAVLLRRRQNRANAKATLVQVECDAINRLAQWVVRLPNRPCGSVDLLLLAQRYATPQIVDGIKPSVSNERQDAVQSLIAEAFREAHVIHVIVSREQDGSRTDLSRPFVRNEVAKIVSKLLGEAQTCFPKS